MANKPLRGRNRARNLALPFVVTAATACTIKPATKEPVPKEEPTAQQPGERPDPRGEAPAHHGSATSGDQPEVHTTSNPPPPEKPIGVATNPPPPPALPVAPTSGGSLTKHDDGTCTWYYSVDCPPNTMCNPPPPKKVQCPEDQSGAK